MRCFTCGIDGHMAGNCPNARDLNDDNNGRPRWCGTCDERTRQVNLEDDHVRRCECHPKYRQLLPQHRRCQGCRQMVYAWEVMPCGSHEPLAQRYRVYVAPPDLREHLDHQALAAKQLAEYRALRAASPVLADPAPATQDNRGYL